MLVYEHDRTEVIVDRLRNAETVLRLVTVVSYIALFGLAGIVAGSIGGTGSGAIWGGMIRAVVGLVLGNLSMVVVSAVIEWMCQLLIAHGEVLEALKRRGRD